MSEKQTVIDGIEKLTIDQAIDISFIKSTGTNAGVFFTLVKKDNGSGYEGSLVDLVNQYAALPQSDKADVKGTVNSTQVSMNGPDCPDCP